MAVNIEDDPSEEAELLNRVTINLRYIAGDLNSLAEAIASSDSDIEALGKSLDNCIAMLMAARRSVPAVGMRGADGPRATKGVRPYRPVQVRERAQWRYFVTPASASNSSAQPSEPRVEIRLQVLDVFESDGKP
jgi:hypothetical protein